MSLSSLWQTPPPSTHRHELAWTIWTLPEWNDQGEEVRRWYQVPGFERDEQTGELVFTIDDQERRLAWGQVSEIVPRPIDVPIA